MFVGILDGAGILGVAGIPVRVGFVAVGLPAGLRYSLVFSALMVLTATSGHVSRLRRGRVLSLRAGERVWPVSEAR